MSIASHSITNHPFPSQLSTSAWKEKLISRQPVLDTQQQTVGYELQLAHEAGVAEHPVVCALDDVSPEAWRVRQCMHQVLCAEALDDITRGRKLFIPFHEQNMLRGDFHLLPATRTCLLLQPHGPVTADLLDACRQAIDQGHELALDATDPHPCSTPPTPDDWKELAAVATMLSVDLGRPRAVESVRQLASMGMQPRLARGVEDRDKLAIAQQLGFALFQGFYFCQPQSLASRTIAPTQVAQLRFLCELNKPRLNFDELEEIIKADIALTCQLLRYMNCAALGVKQRITSVKQAMVLLGEKPMRQWGSLVAVTCLGQRQPAELLLTTLVRARFCEKLACHAGLQDEALDLFLTGLFSTLDVLLEMPMAAALEKMPVSIQVCRTLQGEVAGDFGRIYTLACAAQRGAWASVIELANALHLTHHQIACEYYQTLQWTQQFFTGPQAA